MHCWTSFEGKQLPGQNSQRVSLGFVPICFHEGIARQELLDYCLLLLMIYQHHMI